MPLPGEPFGDLGEPERVLGDDLAHPAVATGRGRCQHAVLVPQIDREAVDLQFGQPIDVPPGGGPRLLRPIAQLLDGEDVVEAEHPLGVLDRREPGRLGGTDHLCRRVLPLQLGVQAFELFQAPHPAVVRGIVDE